jgi:hypothetical protein
MNLHEEIDKKLGEVNVVQIQGEKAVDTYVWKSDDFRWQRLSPLVGEHPYYQKYQMVNILAALPHISRRKGTVLVVSLIDTATKIEA